MLCIASKYLRTNCLLLGFSMLSSCVPALAGLVFLLSPGLVLFFSVFRLFRLVFLGSLSDGFCFDSCSLCDFTACIGMRPTQRL